MTLFQKLDRFPPVVIRLLAKHKGSAMTDAEIAAALVTTARPKWVVDAVPLPEVKRLSYLTSWDHVTIGTTRAFLHACNCNLEDRDTFRNLSRYLRQDPKFTHLRKSERFPEFREMLGVWMEYGVTAKAWPFYDTK
jgi:hypothetical protein